MGSYSDSSSDSDDELPVFDFLQKAGRCSQTPGEDDAPRVTSLPDAAGARGADVMMISSDSDDEVPYVPLAQRLKQKQLDNVTVPAASDEISHRNNGLSECARPNGLHQVRTASHGSTETSPAKRNGVRRTAEEIQASKEEAVRRRQAKGTQQQQQQQQGDKETLRQEQDRLKAERKALAQAAKALRPEECIKHMVVAVDPALLQLEGGGTLLASVQALGCGCAIEKQAIPRSVSWMRRTPGGTQSEDWVCEAEAHVVMQMTAEDIVTLIHSYIQEERHGRSAGGPTLTSWVQEQQRRHPDKSLSLVVVDLETYFRSQQKSQGKKKSREAGAGEEPGGGKVKRRRKNGAAEALPHPQVSRVEVEEAVVHLQLHTGVSVRFLPTWKAFSEHITMTTKAVAEAPFKRQRDQTGFSFHLESEWAGGQKVDRGGKGLLQVWKKQIQQLNRVSPDMAAAILAAYPSPQLLNKAYGVCRTEGEKVRLLSELLIRRGEGVTSTSRRVGPELSKRLFLLMASRDPEQTLD